jgi:hypothetical protein
MAVETWLEHNAEILWNSSDSTIFNLDGNRLSTISRWNFIGRFIKWIKDRDGSLTAKINDVVKNTFETIAGVNEGKTNFICKGGKKLVYVHDKGKGLWAFLFDATYAYSKQYPAYLMADKIRQNPQFSDNNNVRPAVMKVFMQEPLYPVSKDKMKLPNPSYANGNIYEDRKVLYFYE